MSEPFLAEIRAFPFNFAPEGWALCNGQLLPINQNQALYSLLGNTYGGDGVTTFAVPDLRGRAPVHIGNGVTLGQSAGEENHTLTTTEMPAHSHAAVGGNQQPTQTPGGNTWGTVPSAEGGTPLYSSQAPNAQMNPAAIQAAGGGQAHPNMQPFLTLNFCIAVQGIYPSRN